MSTLIDLVEINQIDFDFDYCSSIFYVDIVFLCSSPSVCPSSVVCRLSSTLLNIFSSETADPIKVKFHMERPWDRGTKVCSNGPGHMTKMAALPIYGKNLTKSSSSEPKGIRP